MKFVVDAQLSIRVAQLLRAAGHDALHTLELPRANRTSDAEITRRADADDRVVITKDRDFRDAHVLSGTPRRLLLVTTGNITNNELLTLFQDHLVEIVAAFNGADFVQLSRDSLSISPRRRGL